MRKSVRLCIGVLSGTSADAAEAALCRIRGSGTRCKVELIAHASLPFDASLRSRILVADSARELSELNFILGERFAEAAAKVAENAGVPLKKIDVIGSHGQTIAHLPPGFGNPPSTLQIGEAAVIAERTGVPVVCDFRTRDVAAGGHGAPLVPYADWILFRKRGAVRAFQNIGGIANLSVVGAKLEDTLAFDTGPGNMVLDSLARRITRGQLACDLDGSLSRQGTPIPELLQELMAHPFLSANPPKSAGRELFGEGFVGPLWDRFRTRPYDLIATALAFTVEAIATAYERWVFPRRKPEAIYLSGGGSRNASLLESLRQRLGSVPIRLITELGFPEAAKEAACFALLASECLAGSPANVPRATGARHPVILGKMVP